MLRVALTHDVDRVHKSHQYLTHSLRSLKRRDFRQFSYHVISLFRTNPYWNFPRIIAIENDHAVKSTFFFLNETMKFRLLPASNWKLSMGRFDIEAEMIKEMIVWLDRNGWEIGLHGSYNSFKDPELLRREKKTLEDILGHDVIGTRQHYLNLDGNETWKIHRKLGLKYDSSWGHTCDIGFKDNRCRPFRPLEDDFLVVPVVVMDQCFMSAGNRWQRLRQILDECEQHDSIFVICWHQCVFNEREYPGFTKSYERIIDACAERNATFVTLSEVYMDSVSRNGLDSKLPATV